MSFILANSTRPNPVVDLRDHFEVGKRGRKGEGREGKGKGWMMGGEADSEGGAARSVFVSAVKML